MGLAALGAAGFAVAAVTLSLGINEWAGFCRPNYRGRKIPAAGGLGFVVGPLAAWGALAAHGDTDARFLGWCALAVLVMAAAGLADDVYGSREVSGLAGHLRSLWRGRVTTGVVKIAAGALVGLTVGWLLARPSIAGTLLNAAVIALGTNLVNLLDVRPGRGMKGFLLLCAIAVAADVRALYAVAPIGVIALAFAPLDLGGRAMMGDTGANALGVAAGIALAGALPPWWRVALLAGLVAVHLCSEFCSITALIARAPVLRWMDRLGRADDDGR
jgi:UDP-N-acetylmuramyl pentapeptide phosphotransferase/UDP-N-acetylglucosamine-1-phosphate transferase